MRKLVVTTLLVVLNLVASQHDEGETAPYTVTRRTERYEERTYPAARWVCHDTVQNALTSGVSQSLAFFALFNYIRGSNQESREIAMTSPVTMLTTGRENSFNDNLQMCFYLPAAHQASPPTPTASNVYIENRPAFTALVRRFGGRTDNNFVWQQEAERLKQDLQAAGEPGVDYSFFYSAGYDPPMKFTNRRNEIWYIKRQ